MSKSVPQSLGVCYYPEHWPESRWEKDASMMGEAGITYVRVGEFAWSRLEPKRGTFTLDWLTRSLDVLHKHGLKVILGTPTATPPKWLVDDMADMVAVDVNGNPRKFGSRRHYDFSHQAYKKECARIVEIVTKAYGNHPAVVAWQTDNEYGCHNTIESYSPAALKAFQDWCKNKYRTMEKLNEAWGAVFWSMEFNDFSQIDLPNLTVTEANPEHRLDFQRFSSDQVRVFNKLQCDLIRKYSPGRWIMHNYMGAFFSFDHYDVAKDLDAVGWDAYPLGFLNDLVPGEERKERYMRIGDPDLDPFMHDLYRACGNGRWLVIEQQPGPVNWAGYNPAPEPGAVRLWAWEAFAHGAEILSYFRWRQAPFAQEQYHEGLLLPNGDLNEAYHTVCQLRDELKVVDAQVGSKRADVALVFDYESQWAWQIQPQGKDYVYWQVILQYYRQLRHLGLSIDVVPPTVEACKDRKLVLIPALFSPRPELVAQLEKDAQNGTIVLGAGRTGSKTPDFKIPDNLAPGTCQDLFNVSVRRVESLRPGAVVKVDDSSRFVQWREFVRAEGSATVVSSTQDGHPALVRNQVGKGAAYYLAGNVNPHYLYTILESLCKEAGIPTMTLHRDVRIRDNGNVRVLANYGPEEVDVSNVVRRHKVLVGVGRDGEKYGAKVVLKPAELIVLESCPDFSEKK
jgi:beta-galactosidase